ncbi:MAG: glycosyltransferase family 2 protein [Eubacteriales bacterium]|nr:glycosyltransferase family 2 protein [Eubacteriales bacterium]
MSRLSVVLPAYNEELMVGRACREVGESLKRAGILYELVVVNDGSTDGTWEEIIKAGERDPNILGVCFSRNFGKEAAIYAGIAQASGDAVAVMDCDLQHPPETLLEMYRLWQEGYEVVEGIKASRGKETAAHRVCAGFFYEIMSKVSGIPMENASDFKLMDKRAARSILAMPERSLFFRAASSWVGYRTARVEFQVQERPAGTTKWSTKALVRYAFTNIVAFTTLPLQMITGAGFVCFLGSMLLLIYSLAQFFRGKAVEGYTTTIIVLLLIGSAVMVSLGIMGYYIGKIYEEVKRRPRYLVSRIIRGRVGADEEIRHDRP